MAEASHGSEVPFALTCSEEVPTKDRGKTRGGFRSHENQSVVQNVVPNQKGVRKRHALAIASRLQHDVGVPHAKPWKRIWGVHPVGMKPSAPLDIVRLVDERGPQKVCGSAHPRERGCEPGARHGDHGRAGKLERSDVFRTGLPRPIEHIANIDVRAVVTEIRRIVGRVKFELAIGVCGAKCSELGRKPLEAKAWYRPDPQSVDGTEAPQVRSCRHKVSYSGCYPYVVPAARFGQASHSIGALDENGPHPLFQCPNVSTDDRVVDTQGRRGAPDAAKAPYGIKRSEFCEGGQRISRRSLVSGGTLYGCDRGRSRFLAHRF